MEPSHESVAIGGSFAAQVSSTGIPLEIVDAENAQAGGGERNRQNVSADESMEMDTSSSTPAPTVGSQTDSNGQAGLGKTAGAHLGGMGVRGGGGGGNLGLPSDQLSATTGGLEVNVVGSKSAAGSGSGAGRQAQVRDTAAQSAIEHFHQEVARSLGASNSGGSGLEVAPDSIVFPPAGQGGGGSGARVTADASGPELMNVAKRILGGVNVSYGDLDISGMNSSMDQSLEVSTLSTPKSGRGGNVSSMLNDPGSPSSDVDSTFDSSELLNAEELQHDEMTTRLSRAGPIGLATAAAIMTGRKRKRQHIFESNPALRRRHCSKLIRKLKETIVELTARVGLQAAVVFYRPGKSDPKEEPSYKVFGASPLDSCLMNQKAQICSEMDAVLNQQVPVPTKESDLPAAGSDLHELPPVMFDGIPTPVHKMTQAQLRAFIPNMLKYSTGRGKPGWGKDEMKPDWWPGDIPWQNVRSDMRTPEKKKEVPWTEGLRRIVISCYLHHGRLDLLPEFSIEHLPQISAETAQQIQLQLERLQQQGGGGGFMGRSVRGVEGEGGAGSGVVEHSTSETQLVEAGGGEVFTVDTGIGNCDNSGMPTLADATLAEAAAKLQQVADETGEVQYATHLVTVTEKDAKALGQPVGSTTTVLLTAYPGGHSGGVESGTESTELISPPTTSATVPNVQCCVLVSPHDRSCTVPLTLTPSQTV
ncbi:DNA-binding protein P3A2 [Geodia barretti]|uniref:DNA-binding protein P3A2 n=1 Tax=Geodia barretti TaxID=519541 RepID=A0AA35X412_GEOBA|nr:DNA-binding protein P3A2 [Geodia barretti]